MQQGSYSTAPAELRSALSESSFQFADGFAIVTHACDVDRARDSLVVAALVQFPPDKVARYGSGKSPRYFPVFDNLYADFEAIATVTRDSVAEANPIDLEAERARAFRHAAGRKWGRVAIPTHVDGVLKPLQEYFKDRAGKDTFATMISRVKEIRIAVYPDWLEDSDKDSVELTFLFEPGDLSDTESPVAADGVRKEIAAVSPLAPKQTLAKLADLLANCHPASEDDATVWMAITDAFTRMLNDENRKLNTGAQPQISDVIVTAKTKADMTVAEYEETERLDLAHLSSDDEIL